LNKKKGCVGEGETSLESKEKKKRVPFLITHHWAAEASRICPYTSVCKGRKGTGKRRKKSQGGKRSGTNRERGEGDIMGGSYPTFVQEKRVS